MKRQNLLLETNGYFIIIKRLIHDEDIIKNIYAPKNWALKYMKQKLTDRADGRKG